MSIADMLRALGVAEAPPTLAEMGGPDELVAAVAGLPEELLARAAEAAWESWNDISDRPAVVKAVAARLPDVVAPLEYDEVADGLVSAALATGDTHAGVVVAKALAAALDPEAIDERPLHAGAAARCGADLAAEQDATRHLLLAPLVGVQAVPDDAAAPLARAAGRFLDIDDEAWLQALLRDVLLPIRHAAADAAVELACAGLRQAFSATDAGQAASALEAAAALFEEAARADEDRPDAVAFAAAARCALAFGSGDQQEMERRIAEIERCRLMLVAWTPPSDRPSRAVAAAGAWALLAADLLALRRHLDEPDTLRLLDAVEAIADAYYGVRLRVLDDERFGFRAYLHPVVVDRLRAVGQLREGLDRLTEEEGTTSARRTAAAQLVEVSGGDPKAPCRVAAPRLRLAIP